MPTFGVYLDESTRSQIDNEIMRRIVAQPELKFVLTPQKLIRACVKHVIVTKALQNVPISLSEVQI